MHLGLRTPSLCGTVNLAGSRVTVSVVTHGNNEMNERDEREATSVRFYSRGLLTRLHLKGTFRENGARGIRVRILQQPGRCREQLWEEWFSRVLPERSVVAVWQISHVGHAGYKPCPQ